MIHTVLVITERLCHDSEIESTYVHERPLLADGLPAYLGPELELPSERVLGEPGFFSFNRFWWLADRTRQDVGPRVLGIDWGSRPASCCYIDGIGTP